MGAVLEKVSDEWAEWIGRQRIFFVATAPLAGDGHINCSPKGGDSFRILDPNTVVYQDYTGSGAETIGHVRENSRIVIMFCAFEGSPLIVRLHGCGEVLLPGHPDFSELNAKFPSNPGTRAVVRVRLTRVSGSCGMAVPCYRLEGPRADLDEWAEAKGPAGLQDYIRKKNAQSIDGLPAIDVA